ncbi:MAG: nucleoside phosphorylase [Chloroflexota bacterium]|nr:nucleoside phosphorylase [Chloroflexota bacterium]
MSSDLPILQFDPAREAVIEPARLIEETDVPKAAVLCYFTEVIERLCGDGRGKIIGRPGAEGMPFPMYEIELDGRRLAVVFPGVGAPLAAITLEDAIAYGCRKFAVCGAAGALVPELVAGHVVVPEVAVREEGTSYQYIAPSREIRADAHALSVTRSVLEERSVPYTLGKTWTTDAVYRETRARVERRKRDGCLVVEMEAAALMAIAHFRQVQLAYSCTPEIRWRGRIGTTAVFAHTRSERHSSSWPPPSASGFDEYWSAATDGHALRWVLSRRGCDK